MRHFTGRRCRNFAAIGAGKRMTELFSDAVADGGRKTEFPRRTQVRISPHRDEIVRMHKKSSNQIDGRDENHFDSGYQPCAPHKFSFSAQTKTPMGVEILRSPATTAVPSRYNMPRVPSLFEPGAVTNTR